MSQQAPPYESGSVIQSQPPGYGQPPGYAPQQGPPPQGYPPQQGPPPQGYPPQQGPPPQGYPPQGYPPGQQPYPGQPVYVQPVQTQVVSQTTVTIQGVSGQRWLAPFAYCFGVVSGLIVLIVEKQNSYIVFHAWQSFFVCCIYIIGAIAFAIIDSFIFHGFRVLSFIWWLIYMVFWLLGVIMAWNRWPTQNRFVIPGPGNLALWRTRYFEMKLGGGAPPPGTAVVVTQTA